jgi:hypothetical protein
MNSEAIVDFMAGGTVVGAALAGLLLGGDG